MVPVWLCGACVVLVVPMWLCGACVARVVQMWCMCGVCGACVGVHLHKTTTNSMKVANKDCPS